MLKNYISIGKITIQSTNNSFQRKSSLNLKFTQQQQQHLHSFSSSKPNNNNPTTSKQQKSKQHFSSHKPIFISTPIFYVNAKPHLGHLYTSLLGDALARWHRFCGRKTLFMTGTDEHGLKVEQAAKNNGFSDVQAFCDQVSSEFKKLFEAANISYDEYVRTTEPRHRRAVQVFWEMLESRGLIHSGTYEGWYCVPDEAFVPELQVKQDPISGKNIAIESGQPVEWVKEKNYMFKLSLFGEKLREWLRTNPNAIFPPERQEQLLSNILAIENNNNAVSNSPKLEDLSVSRPSSRVRWAIRVPNDPDHSIYVWLDALVNYLTVAGLGGKLNSEKDSEERGIGSLNVWPPDYQILGKDILTFHAIYWPALLMSVGLEPPKRIISHAHWTVEHRKMSKSIGNVVDPIPLMSKYGVDAVRYFLLKEGGMLNDGDFSEQKLVVRLKGDLADTFGNLVSRCLNGKAPAPEDFKNRLPPIGSLNEHDQNLLHKLNSLRDSVAIHFDQCDFSKGIEKIFAVLHETNVYFTQNQPWKLAKMIQEANQLDTKNSTNTTNTNTNTKLDFHEDRLATVMFTTLECIRICSLLLQPVMPDATSKILDRLGISDRERSSSFASVGMKPVGSDFGDSSQDIRPFEVVQSSFQAAPLSIFYSIGSHQLELWKKVKSDDTSKKQSIDFVQDDKIEGKVLELASDDMTGCYIRSCSLGIKLPLLVIVMRRLTGMKPFSFEIEIQDQTNTTRFLRFSSFEEKARYSSPIFASIPIEFHDDPILMPEMNSNASSLIDQMILGENNNNNNNLNLNSNSLESVAQSQIIPTNLTTTTQQTNMNMTVDNNTKEWSQIVINLEFWTRKAFGNSATYKHTVSVQVNACCKLRRIYLTDFHTHHSSIPFEFKLYQLGSQTTNSQTSQTNNNNVVKQE